MTEVFAVASVSVFYGSLNEVLKMISALYGCILKEVVLTNHWRSTHYAGYARA